MKVSRMGRAAGALTILMVLISMSSVCNAQIRVGFYLGKCGKHNVETIIRNVVTTRFLKDRTVTAALLRMYFHDCFVRGCDASLLLDGMSSEKNAGPNFSVRGYDLIDQIKAALERACPGVVSCADVIAAATRDAVGLAGGIRYQIPLGRRDARISNDFDVDLPGPDISIADAISFFRSKGLNAADFVVLLGAHTVGITHCSFVSDRVYNFQGSGRPDPNMNRTLVNSLKTKCPEFAIADNPVNLDQNLPSANIVDNSFYKQIVMKRAILEIDQNMALDKATRFMVAAMANGNNFKALFGEALVKMGNIGVLTGKQGEIRRSCRRVNGR